ncbi:MAG: anti-sigma factor family protein [Tepidiformaceae bacterium]
MADSATADPNTLPAVACREMVELITSYLEGRLSAADTARFDRHLAGCPGCTEYLAQMRRTIATTGSVRAEELTPEKRDELLELFRDWRKAS